MHRFTQENQSVRRRAAGRIKNTENKIREVRLTVFISILLQSKRGAQTKPAPKSGFRLLWGKPGNSFLGLLEFQTRPRQPSSDR